MQNKWFISDTHFLHEKALEFRARFGFQNLDQMHDYIITNWNSVVKDNDIVYHLGDVAFKTTEKAEELDKIMKSLNGIKYLAIGNHDNAVKLAPYFKNITGWFEFPKANFIASHFPLGKHLFRHGITRQVHGHLHDEVVGDPDYISVCVERVNFTPIAFEELKAPRKT